MSGREWLGAAHSIPSVPPDIYGGTARIVKVDNESERDRRLRLRREERMRRQTGNRVETSNTRQNIAVAPRNVRETFLESAVGGQNAPIVKPPILSKRDEVYERKRLERLMQKEEPHNPASYEPSFGGERGRPTKISTGTGLLSPGNKQTSKGDNEWLLHKNVESEKSDRRNTRSAYRDYVRSESSNTPNHSLAKPPGPSGDEWKFFKDRDMEDVQRMRKKDEYRKEVLSSRRHREPGEGTPTSLSTAVPKMVPPRHTSPTSTANLPWDDSELSSKKKRQLEYKRELDKYVQNRVQEMEKESINRHVTPNSNDIPSPISWSGNKYSPVEKDAKRKLQNDYKAELDAQMMMAKDDPFKRHASAKREQEITRADAPPDGPLLNMLRSEAEELREKKRKQEEYRRALDDHTTYSTVGRVPMSRRDSAPNDLSDKPMFGRRAVEDELLEKRKKQEEYRHALDEQSSHSVVRAVPSSRTHEVNDGPFVGRGTVEDELLEKRKKQEEYRRALDEQSAYTSVPSAATAMPMVGMVSKEQDVAGNNPFVGHASDEEELLEKRRRQMEYKRLLDECSAGRIGGDIGERRQLGGRIDNLDVNVAKGVMPAAALPGSEGVIRVDGGVGMNGQRKRFANEMSLPENEERRMREEQKRAMGNALQAQMEELRHRKEREKKERIRNEKLEEERIRRDQERMDAELKAEREVREEKTENQVVNERRTSEAPQAVDHPQQNMIDEVDSLFVDDVPERKANIFAPSSAVQHAPSDWRGDNNQVSDSEIKSVLEELRLTREEMHAERNNLLSEREQMNARLEEQRSLMNELRQTLRDERDRCCRIESEKRDVEELLRERERELASKNVVHVKEQTSGVVTPPGKINGELFGTDVHADDATDGRDYDDVVVGRGSKGVEGMYELTAPSSAVRGIDDPEIHKNDLFGGDATKDFQDDDGYLDEQKDIQTSGDHDESLGMAFQQSPRIPIPPKRPDSLKRSVFSPEKKHRDVRMSKWMTSMVAETRFIYPTNSSLGDRPSDEMDYPLSPICVTDTSTSPPDEGPIMPSRRRRWSEQSAATLEQSLIADTTYVHPLDHVSGFADVSEIESDNDDM